MKVEEIKVEEIEASHTLCGAVSCCQTHIQCYLQCSSLGENVDDPRLEL